MHRKTNQRRQKILERGPSTTISRELSTRCCGHQRFLEQLISPDLRGRFIGDKGSRSDTNAGTPFHTHTYLEGGAQTHRHIARIHAYKHTRTHTHYARTYPQADIVCQPLCKSSALSYTSTTTPSTKISRIATNSGKCVFACAWFWQHNSLGDHGLHSKMTVIRL
mmetsp:Transcript_93081/g.150290  ORF Transcript_93081/g.150290 Transcript_93081/m.150290 type:complete len:165 (-) Transcript_93081:252-746(-)